MEMLTYLSIRREATNTDPSEQNFPTEVLTYLSTRRDGTDTDSSELDCPMEMLTYLSTHRDGNCRRLTVRDPSHGNAQLIACFW